MAPQSLPMAHNGGMLFIITLGVILFAVWSLTTPSPEEDPRRSAQLAGPRVLVRNIALGGFVLAFLVVLLCTVFG